MKNLLIILFLLTINNIAAQKQEVFLSLGKATFTDKFKNTGNFSIGAHYLNKTFSSFGFEGYLEYNQSNNLPELVNNTNQLDVFIKNLTIENIIGETLWSNINYFGLGTRVHYTFVNKERFFFSFFGGIGYHFSESKVFVLSRFSHTQNTGQITDFDSSIKKEKESAFFTTIGLRFTYAIQKKYTVGVILNYHSMLLNDENFSKILLLTNNYNLGLTIGKQF